MKALLPPPPALRVSLRIIGRNGRIETAITPALIRLNGDGTVNRTTPTTTSMSTPTPRNVTPRNDWMPAVVGLLPPAPLRYSRVGMPSPAACAAARTSGGICGCWGYAMPGYPGGGEFDWPGNCCSFCPAKEEKGSHLNKLLI